MTRCSSTLLKIKVRIKWVRHVKPHPIDIPVADSASLGRAAVASKLSGRSSCLCGGKSASPRGPLPISCGACGFRSSTHGWEKAPSRAGRPQAVGEGAALTDIAFEPVSSNRSLRCEETEFSGQRQRGRNAPGDSRTPVQRQNLARQLRQFGANRQVPGNLR